MLPDGVVLKGPCALVTFSGPIHKASFVWERPIKTVEQFLNAVETVGQFYAEKSLLAGETAEFTVNGNTLESCTLQLLIGSLTFQLQG